LGKSVVKKPNRIELPRLTRFLIIASYLASYNPSKLDVRFFTKGSESRHKVSKKAIHNGTKKRQQLLGPRSFGLERMLAIFYSIVHDNVRTFADIHSQIANCISLKLILKISNKNNLDVVSMKSNVSFGLVKELGRSVDFDITQYLFDFIDN
jgi:origin recognition complex subunit 5